MRNFDLNIEEVLEHWEIPDAIREIIANALDEQILTQTAEVQIYENDEGWHVRDFGRGLHYQHLTQKENEEKLDHEGLIGRFGVGLKDALATLFRREVTVEIRSQHGRFTLAMRPKEDFTDVETLHAVLDETDLPNIEGTDVILKGATKADIEQAKAFFLRFSGEQLLESTNYGEVYARKGEIARIYVNGVKVAEEEKFLFSYNITSLTAAMKNALNRERTHVGRSAYTDRVKSILRGCTSREVVRALIADIEAKSRGHNRDETGWIDIAVHAVGLLNQQENVVFVTPQEAAKNPDAIDHAKGDGYRIVFVDEALANKIRGKKDASGQIIRDLTQYIEEFDASFQYTFVEPEDLGKAEQAIFTFQNEIFALIGGKPHNIRTIRISETMRLGKGSDADGVWVSEEQTIIIKRTQLQSLASFAGTLFHETAHAQTGASDVTREFEQGLTNLLGKLTENALT